MADAAAILTAFVPPPGACRLAKVPGTDGGYLRYPSSTVVSTALVDDASFWLAPGQPLSTIGVASCPASLAPALRLTFRSSPGGPVLAAAQGPAPCAIVLFTLGGRQQPALQVPDGFVSQVLTIAGLRWRLS